MVILANSLLVKDDNLCFLLRFSSLTVAPSGHLVNIPAWVHQRLRLKSEGIEKLGGLGKH